MKKLIILLVVAIATIVSVNAANVDATVLQGYKDRLTSLTDAKDINDLQCKIAVAEAPISSFQDIKDTIYPLVSEYDKDKDKGVTAINAHVTGKALYESATMFKSNPVIIKEAYPIAIATNHIISIYFMYINSNDILKISDEQRFDTLYSLFIKGGYDSPHANRLLSLMQQISLSLPDAKVKEAYTKMNRLVTGKLTTNKDKYGPLVTEIRLMLTTF